MMLCSLSRLLVALNPNYFPVFRSVLRHIDELTGL